MEISCFCNRLYRMSEPTSVNECAFSGSLCRNREFKTDDGLRYCLTIFNLADYKHSHFPHDEYNCLISKLNILQSPNGMLPTTSNSDTLSVKQMPFVLDLKIKFGIHNLTIGPVTAFGLVKTSPFTDVDVFSVEKKIYMRFQMGYMYMHNVFSLQTVSRF